MFAQVLFSGLALGSIYGLVALGFAVVFKATEVFNFAQGMLAVCGAYFAVTAISILQLPFPLAILFMVTASAILGVAIHMTLIQPLSGRSMLAVIMVTIALAIVRAKAAGAEILIDIKDECCVRSSRSSMARRAAPWTRLFPTGSSDSGNCEFPSCI